MKKNGKLWIALVGVIVGVALLFFGGRLADAEETPSDTLSDSETIRLDMETYRQALEGRVAALCARVEGAGKVTAVVNLEGGFEYVYATDVKTTTGGSSSQYITIGSGSGEQMVYVTQRVPDVKGIGVVCAGGNDAAVRQEITALLSATFGVGSHKIYVTGGG